MDIKMLNDTLRAAIAEVKGLDPEKNKDDVIEMRPGKFYATVKIRNDIFRRYFGMDAGYTSTYELVQPYSYKVLRGGKETTMYFPGSVICKTEVFYKNKFLATGIAEEVRGSNKVNMTSAVENAQTSSLGRALACIGLTSHEFASADEMQGVKRKGENNDIANDDKQPEFGADSKTNKSLNVNIDLRQLILGAKHLGDLNKILTSHSDVIEKDNELKELFAKEKKRMEEGKPKTLEDDEVWYG